MSNSKPISLDNLQLKEELRGILDKIQGVTDYTQEDIAVKMGYKKNYISEMLTPRGVVTNKFLDKIKLRFSDVLNGKSQKVNNAHSDLTTLLTQLMAKQNQLMEMQNKILAEQKESLVDKVQEIHSNSKATIMYLETILRVNRADDSVIMDNQDEQQNRAVGSSAIKAGKLELAAADRTQKKGKRNQHAGGK